MKGYTIQKVGSCLIIAFILLSLLIPTAISAIDSKQTTSKNETQTTSGIQRLFPEQLKKTKPTQLPFLESTVRTTCGSVEKTTQITFGLFNEINVDNDENTGPNGNDISIQYIILPWIEVEPTIQLGLRFSVFIERIGEEIKSEDFTLSSTMFDGLMHLGYESPQVTDNEIPESLELSAFLYTSLETGTVGVTYEMNPNYETEDSDHELIFFTAYTNEETTYSYEFMFEPVTSKQITIESTPREGIFQYSVTRGHTEPTKATLNIERATGEEIIEHDIIINPLPTDLSFTLGITPFRQGGGVIEYESETNYDTSIFIESNNMGTCNYALVKNTPKSAYIEWDPAKQDGYYYLTIDAIDTDIFITDSLVQPTINLSIQDIGDVQFTAYWNFTNPGDFTIIKENQFHINLDVVIGVWEARIDAEPTAENIDVAWLTDTTGYFYLDTDFVPLQTIDLLVKGSDIGIRTEGEFIKADDFLLEWTVWPPIEFNIEYEGELDFSSILIEAYIEGAWYRLWPWF